MAYLLTSKQIEDALGAAGCTKPGDQPIDQYIVALGMVLSRVEGLLNVQTLVRGVYTDTFTVLDERQSGQLLRLSNAFLPSPLSCALTDGSGNAIGNLGVDRLHGIVHAPRLSRGVHTVTYMSGLEVDADGFFVDVPNWLTSIAINCIVIWYRLGVINPRMPKDGSLSYSALMHATIRELQTRVYESYQRPRVDVLWPEQLTYGD